MTPDTIFFFVHSKLFDVRYWSFFNFILGKSFLIYFKYRGRHCSCKVFPGPFFPSPSPSPSPPQFDACAVGRPHRCGTRDTVTSGRRPRTAGLRKPDPETERPPCSSPARISCGPRVLLFQAPSSNKDPTRCKPRSSWPCSSTTRTTRRGDSNFRRTWT